MPWKPKLGGLLLFTAFFSSFLSQPQTSTAQGNLERCTDDWSEYVVLVAEWKKIHVEMQGHEFLFIGPDYAIYNCLGEGFSEKYIAGLKQSVIKTRFFGLHQMDVAEAEFCGLTQVTSDPPTFTLVRLPYNSEILEGERCRELLVKVMPLTFFE